MDEQEPPGIRIAAFGQRRPQRGWVAAGLQVCTYTGSAGALNGYVRLPASHPDLLLAEAAELMPGTPFTYPDGSPGMNHNRGYDHVDVDCPGGWTYGPDFEGWIGFDTSHVQDHWSREDRLRFAQTDRERAQVSVYLDCGLEFPMGSMPGDRLWSEEALEAAVEEAAQHLAERARVAIREARG